MSDWPLDNGSAGLGAIAAGSNVVVTITATPTLGNDHLEHGLGLDFDDRHQCRQRQRPRIHDGHRRGPTQVRVETLANGSGIVVAAQSVGSGSSITVFAISRDASNNFVANVSATWSLTGATGGVVASDLVAPTPPRQERDLHRPCHRHGHIHAVEAFSGDSGLLTAVSAGTATQVRVETLANGTGVVVPAQSLAAGTPLTVFAISRDGSTTSWPTSRPPGR